jgi:hypothetical protein
MDASVYPDCSGAGAQGRQSDLHDQEGPVLHRAARRLMGQCHKIFGPSLIVLNEASTQTLIYCALPNLIFHVNSFKYFVNCGRLSFIGRTEYDRRVTR